MRVAGHRNCFCIEKNDQENKWEILRWGDETRKFLPFHLGKFTIYISEDHAYSVMFGLIGY